MTEKLEEPLQEGNSIELYPLPNGWKWGTVSDAGAHQKNAIVDGPFGSNLKVSDYVEGGPVPVLTTKNLEGKYDDVRYITKAKFEELKRSAVYPGDILMAKIGSCGKTGIYPLNHPPAMIPANLLKVSLNDQFELKYVYYYFNSSFFQNALRTITKATAQPAFGVTNFRKLPLPYSTRNQQKRIVAEIEKQFSRLDEAVATLKRVKANLKRYKASVLKAAVEGKLTEDWRKQHPNVEPASKLLERILSERRAKWRGKGKYKELEEPDTTGLPPLPKSWTWARVEQLGVTFGGLTKNPKRAKFTKKLPYLRVANVYANELRLDEIEYIGVQVSELDKLLLRKGDLLVVEGNGSKSQIGRLAIWDGSIDPCVHQNHLIKVRLVVDSMNKWILFWLLSPVGRHFIEEVSSSTSGLYTLSVNKVGDLPVVVPSLAEQEQIVAEVERRLSVIEELETAVEANLTRAERLRQSVLGDAFSGKLVRATV